MEFKPKHILLGTTLIFIGSLLYFFVISGGNQSSEKSGDSWVTFKKTSPKKIDSYPTTPKEKEEARINHLDQSKAQIMSQRKPASKKPISGKSEEISLPGRVWSLYSNQSLPDKISFLNEPRKDWKEIMGQDIMRFLRPETKIFVKKEKSLTLLKRNGGLHVEQVYVKMISPEGRQYGYQAFVDSETGKVIKTWNQTIHEPMGKEPPKFRPTGIINPNGSQQF